MAKTPEKVTGKAILEENLMRLDQNRKLMMDFAYIHMAENAKKLEVYSKLYQDASFEIDVDVEFKKAMEHIKTIKSKDKEEFEKVKLR